ncbi:MAG: Fic family protein [Ignavibacteria bacterium]|nr:Fic family protein [Ignavibacteria bacterium]
MAQQAWYKRYEEYRDEALRYFRAVRIIIPRKDAERIIYGNELSSFIRLADSRLIFESNIIEKAGTKTLGETREIIRQNFPSFPDDYSMAVLPQKLQDMKIAIEKFKDKTLIPSIVFGSKSRTEREVLQHREAIVHMTNVSTAFITIYQREWSKAIAKSDPNMTDDEIEKNLDILLVFLEGISAVMKRPTILSPDGLFTSTRIQAIHRILAQGLLPEDAEVEAGEYRIHDIQIVGVDVKLPSMELVPAAMAKFITESNMRVGEVLAGKWSDFIMVAAEISYNFVRIHPFPDFNGRMSRLLLAMTLRAFGIPFSLTLRGRDAKSRNRYFYALKRANHGDLKPYATLIAMRLVESFREIDDNLRLAGHPALLEITET